MKKTALLLGTISLVFGLITPAAASLVDDEVLVQYIEVNNLMESQSVTVTGDATDVIQTVWGAASVDMGPSGVEIDFLWTNALAPDSRFSGIKIIGLNDIANPDWLVLDVDVTTPMDGWTNDRIDFGYDNEMGSWVSFAWQDLTMEQNESFDAIFTFGPNPIPIPATMALFVTGLVGFVIIRRRLNT